MTIIIWIVNRLSEYSNIVELAIVVRTNVKYLYLLITFKPHTIKNMTKSVHRSFLFNKIDIWKDKKNFFNSAD